MLQNDFLQRNGFKLARMHYKRPTTPMDALRCTELVWNDEMIADEESGSNRQLGFCFLYECLSKQISISFNGRDISRSMPELLTRFWHLKHSRWGTVQAGQGEEELCSSLGMARLALMCDMPDAAAPELPTDNQTRSLLEHGVDLHSRMAVRSQLRGFTQELEQCCTILMTSQTQDLRVEALRTEHAIARTQHLSPKQSVHVGYDNICVRVGSPSDTSCNLRSYGTCPLPSRSHESSKQTERADIEAFLSSPLEVIGLEQFVSWEPATKADGVVKEDLPFDLTNHSSARSRVAKDIIDRMAVDAKGFASTVNTSRVPKLRGLSADDIAALKLNPEKIKAALDSLEKLTVSLRSVYEQDTSIMFESLDFLENAANHSSTDDTVENCRFRLLRDAGQRALLRTPYVVATLLSSKALEDLRRINPFLADTQASFVLKAAVSACLYCSRVSQYHFVMGSVVSLKSLILRLGPPTKSVSSSSPSLSSLKRNLGNAELSAIARQIEHVAGDVARSVTAKRHYFAKAQNIDDFSVEFDPRFLMFEFIFNILIRKRQVEMVNWFVDATKNGESRVQQMIMGAGKTTVVGPLLTLMLADGDTLVSQVMPSALLDMSRNVLRSRFSAIIPKKIFTLQFDRTCDDSTELVAALYAKLENAKKNRGVVCAAPEAIKSLLLKFIEQLHSIEAFDMESLVPSEFSRRNTEITRLRDMMTARSEMADSLVKVLAMWKDGVLIMDEVDVLLHPLRSELNFPIGSKFPIDLAPFRWDFPIFLLDVIFYSARHCICEDVPADAQKKAGVDLVDVLQRLDLLIKEGYKTHKLQHSPHLVLLDEGWYHANMKKLVAQSALVWLHANFVGKVQVSNVVLLEYLCGDAAAVEKCRTAVEEGLLKESKKLLNLCRDWVRMLLPHCLSKINRVSYGILGPADMDMVDPRMPNSRKVMAVPFVGKDVPSRASEFAHPDVLIGLTVLAYRYEGCRKSDLIRVVTQLKQDFGRQLGPRDERPASQLFASWMTLLAKEKGKQSHRDLPVLPLGQFQPNDRTQLLRLFNLVNKCVT